MKFCLIYGAVLGAICTLPAWADPDDSVLTTYSEIGQRQLDFKAGTFRQKNQPDQSATTIGVGYGITQSWFAEPYVTYAKSGSDAISLDSAAIQDTFLLTAPDSIADLGLFTELEYEHDRTAGEKLIFGPLLQVDIGLTRVNANLIIQRNYRAEFSNPMVLKYQWQVKHHWNLPVDFGLQVFGELGRWDQWAPKEQQSHRAGPALFGKIDLGDHGVLNYNAAILFDLTNENHGTTIKMQAVLGF